MADVFDFEHGSLAFFRPTGTFQNIPNPPSAPAFRDEWSQGNVQAMTSVGLPVSGQTLVLG